MTSVPPLPPEPPPGPLPQARPMVITGAAVVSGLGGVAPADVLVRDGRVAAVTEPGTLDHLDADVVDGADATLTPGLIDLHLHGGFGHSFTTADADGVDAMRTGLLARGVTTAQASLVSADATTLRRQVERLAHATVERPGRTRVHGVHLEGPHLSAAQCGAHDPSALRSPTEADHALIRDHGAIITMITVAPELDGMIDLITRYTASGGVAAVGHSEAGTAELAAAAAAGASHLTHLWSGMSLMHRDGPWRVPGLVEASLASTGMTAEVIADGRHLPPTLLEVARRCLGGRLALVSDATAGAGMPEGYRYSLGTVECVVADGVGQVVGQDAFGGSTTLLPDMLRYVVTQLGWPVGEAVPMATTVPAAVLGRRDLGRISPGARADLVLWDADWRVVAVWQDGRPVSPSPPR